MKIQKELNEDNKSEKAVVTSDSLNGIEDLKQIKSDDELKQKCYEIMYSLKDFTKNEKYRILITLYDSFMEACKKEGIVFLEFGDKAQ